MGCSGVARGASGAVQGRFTSLPRRMPRLPIAPAVLSAVLVSLVVAGCGDDEEDTPAADGSAAECEDVEQAEPKRVSLKRPPLDPPPAGTVAVFETSCGTIEIELDTERAPRTTASFAHLVEEGVYDGTGFHRVAPDFVIQGGDPSGDGTGGPGYFVDEPPPPSLAYTEGTVAMAKTAAEPPGRSGSQFYVVTGADAGLPPEYALVGEVVGGEDVVAAIEDLGPPGGDGPPSKPVVIERATLEEA
jgi:peptidyl-prolyl cis-trans isomerase B (cyclophilin B)